MGDGRQWDHDSQGPERAAGTSACDCRGGRSSGVGYRRGPRRGHRCICHDGLSRPCDPRSQWSAAAPPRPGGCGCQRFARGGRHISAGAEFDGQAGGSRPCRRSHWPRMLDHARRLDVGSVAAAVPRRPLTTDGCYQFPLGGRRGHCQWLGQARRLRWRVPVLGEVVDGPRGGSDDPFHARGSVLSVRFGDLRGRLLSPVPGGRRGQAGHARVSREAGPAARPHQVRTTRAVQICRSDGI